MKNFIFFLFSIILLSCERNEIDFLTTQSEKIENLDSEQLIIKTRTANGESSNVPDILEQISDVPVNILNVGAIGKKYLSVAKKGTTVDLFSHDDGSQRQRFLIKGGFPMRLCLLGGSSSYNPGEIYVELPAVKSPILLEAGKNSHLGPGIVTGPVIDHIMFNKSENDPQKYYINGSMAVVLNGKILINKLRPTSRNSTSLEFSTETSYYSEDLWQIIPLEQFELQGIRYILENDDYINKVATLLKTYTYTNINGSTPITTNVKINETLTTTSTFQQSQGLSFGAKLATTVKVGIPEINSDMSVSNEYTTNNTFNFQYNQTQTKSVAYENNHTFTIPAFTNAVVSVHKSDYVGKITYIAKVKGKTSGKILYIKGKWEGVIGDDVHLNPVYTSATNPSGQPFIIPGANMLNDLMKK